MRDDDLYLLEIDDDELDEPYWTRRRIVWTVLALLIIAALIASMIAPLLFQIANPSPLPPTPMLGRI